MRYAPSVAPPYPVTSSARATAEYAVPFSSAAAGQIVYHWPAGPMENARVVVYQAPRSFATHPWTKAPAVRIPILPVSRSRD